MCRVLVALWLVYIHVRYIYNVTSYWNKLHDIGLAWIKKQSVMQQPLIYASDASFEHFNLYVTACFWKTDVNLSVISILVIFNTEGSHSDDFGLMLTDWRHTKKLSHTCYQALGPELIPVYRQSSRRWLFKSSRLPLLWPVVTFPAEKRHRPLTDTKLYCLVTETHRCEQLAQGCYSALRSFISPIPAAKHKTHNTQRNKMTTD